MAAINFPDAPTNGQIFESGGMSWTYVAGIGWTLNSAIVEAGSGFTFIADTMPLPVNVGDTWFDSSTGASGGTSWVAVEEGPAGASEKVWVQFAPGVGTSAIGVKQYPNKAALDAVTPAPPDGTMALTTSPPTGWTYYQGVWYPTSGMMPFHSVYLGTTGVANGTFTTLSWTNLRASNHFGAWTGAVTSVTIPYKGVWTITLQVCWAPSGSGYRLIELVSYPTQYVHQTTVVPNVSANYGSNAQIAGTFIFNAGDQIYVRVMQDSGAALNIAGANASNLSTYWSIVWEGIV